MAQLVICHEDTIQNKMSEQQFLLHFNTGQDSIIPHLLGLSRQWHLLEKKEVPLRHVLAKAMIEVLLERVMKLAQVESTADLVRDCQKYNIVDSNTMMPCLQW